MARLLSVAEFGVLSSLFVIIYVLSGFSESIQIVIAKHATEEKNKGKNKNILKRALKKSFSISIFLFLAFLVLAVVMVYLTKINYLLITLTGLMIFVAFLIPICRGMLQGKKKFFGLGVNMISESVIKLVLAIVFVAAGIGVYGAIFGTLIGSFAALGFSFIPLREIVKSEEKRTDSKQIYNYTASSFFVVLTTLFFYSIDVFIARIVFSPEEAGIYAIASILAKTIFLGTQPISRAMFPLSAENHKDRKKTNNVFANALIILLTMICIALTIFYFFSDIIILIFSGKKLTEASLILFYLAIATSFISLANLNLLYRLSTGKYRSYSYLVLFVLLEVFLLVYFSENLVQFSIAFMASAAAFLWGSVVLFNR